MKLLKYDTPFALKTDTPNLTGATYHLNHDPQTRESQPPPATAPPSDRFPPLENVTRPTVSTDAAAYYLNRKPQTLRAWACLENGPLRPVRINGRLAWGVADIKRLHGGG